MGRANLSDPISFFSRLSDKPLTSAQWLIPEIGRPDRNQMRFKKATADRASIAAGREEFLDRALEVVKNTGK